MFKIESIKQPSIEYGELCMRGRITIAEFSEEFLSSLTFWNPEQYRSQWVDAAKRIASGQERSAFITDMRDPQSSNYVTWWPIYVVGRLAVFHQQILFMDQLGQPFDLSNPYRHLSKFLSTSEDGLPISSWRIDLDEIKSFAGAA